MPTAPKPKPKKKYKLRKPVEDKPTTPRVEIPNLVRRIGVLSDMKKDIDAEQKTLKKQLELHFNSAGIKTAEGGEYMASRVQVEDKVRWSKENLAAIYGDDHVKEAERLLREHGFVSNVTFVTVKRKPKKKKPPVTDDRDVESEVKEFFGGKE